MMAKRKEADAGFSIPITLVMHFAFPPTISAKFINFPIFSFNLSFFGLIYVFSFPPILTMMHLCIILYRYWTPLGRRHDCVVAEALKAVLVVVTSIMGIFREVYKISQIQISPTFLATPLTSMMTSMKVFMATSAAAVSTLTDDADAAAEDVLFFLLPRLHRCS